MVINNSKKRIWYISHYVAPPEYDTHSRALKFTQYLSEDGYDVTIFSSSFLHNKNIDLITDNSSFIELKYRGIKFVHIKTKKYVSNGLLRVYALFQFALRIYFLKNKFEKPDIIIHTAHVPFENLVYYVAKKLKAEYVSEVLDLWPESFVAYGLLNRRNPFLHLAYMTEKWLYKKADKIVFSMQGGKDYIIDKGWDSDHGGPIDLKDVFYINNGVDLNDFDENKKQYIIDDPDLNDEGTFKIIYLGSIRLANNLKQLIDAAYILKEHSNIKFLIYGDGNDRKVLEKYCKDKNINNVLFKQKWIELKYVPGVLSKSSLNVINYMPSDILRYGGSQGKLFQYLASGKPICSNVKMGYCLINAHKLGIAENFRTSKEYAESILSISKLNEDDYKMMCSRVYKVAQEYDFRKQAQKLIDILA